MRASRPALLLMLPVLPIALLSACGDSKDSAQSAGEQAASGASIGVAASDTGCAIDTASIPAGPATLKIHNSGSKKTEVYVLKDNGTAIVSEREGIGPNTDADLTVQLAGGSYLVSCRPEAL